ncbi:MAG: Gfo/Idh/MocA family oxidoreductase [Pseudomonadota bacterium]
MSNAPIRVGILGLGIGVQHLEAYRTLPDLYTVRTLCDRDIGRAEQAAADLASVDIEEEVDRVFEDPEIDLVDICLPPNLHYEVTKKALEEGKHVVCEKPLVGSLREVDELDQLSRARDRLLAPVFQYRYGPGLAALKALIAGGLAGKPYIASLETHWNRGAKYYAIPWRGTWAGENGGAVLGHAIHSHDLLCYVLGPVARISAVTATRVNPIETEDCAAVQFTMENGALATSSITLGAAENTSRLRFCFEGLTAESDNLPYKPAEGNWRFTARDPDQQGEIDAIVSASADAKSGFVGFFSAVANAINGSPGNEVTVRDGRRSIELVSAIYLAAQTAHSVELPLNQESPVYSGWTQSLITT